MHPLTPSMKLLALALAFALTLSGCQLFGPDSNAPDRVALDASFDAANIQVTMRLTNRTSQAIGYNMCTSPIEHLATGALYYNPFVFCSPELVSLAPGTEVEDVNQFEPKSLPSGS